MFKVFAKPFGHILAVSLMLAIPMPALADDDVLVLTPATPWTLSKGERSCLATQVFSDGKHEMILEFESFSREMLLRSHVVSNNLQIESDRPQIRFMPNDTWPTINDIFEIDAQGIAGFGFKASLLSSIDNSDEGRPSFAKRRDEASQHAIATKNIVISEGFSQDVILQTGSLQSIFTSFSTCLDELERDFGLDPQREIATFGKRLQFQSLARDIMKAYPPEKRRARESAVFDIIILIETDGTVYNCFHTERWDVGVFEEAACGVVLEKARYEPSFNANGEAIRALDRMTVGYRPSK